MNEGNAFENVYIKDRATYFLNQTIFNAAIAQKLAPAPEIAGTSLAKQEKEETFTKAVEQMKEFTSTEVGSILRNILNGFARESKGWNQYAIGASLEIMPFIGLKKITSGEIAARYREAIVTILPSYRGTSDRSFEALIEAGMILVPHMSTVLRNKTEAEVVPALRQELKKRRQGTNDDAYEYLIGKIDNLDNALKTGLINPIVVSPKDTTEFANRFREFGKDSRYEHFSPEQFSRLDLLVLEAITNFAMTHIQIVELSGMTNNKIKASIRRLKASSSIPDRNVHEGSLSLQVQELLEKIPLTLSQTAHILGPGITPHTVGRAKRRLIRNGFQQANKPQEKTSPEQNIIDLRRQGFSRSQIVDQLNMPAAQVQYLIVKLMSEGRIERQINSSRINHPITERGIKIDAYVDEMQSNNPGITWKEIAKRLNLPIHAIGQSQGRLKVYRQIEQLIQQGKTSQQIAGAIGIDEAKAKFDIARLQKLRDLQRSLT